MENAITGVTEMMGPNPHEWVQRFGGPKITLGSWGHVANPGLEGWWVCRHHNSIRSIPLCLHVVLKDSTIIGMVYPSDDGEGLVCDVNLLPYEKAESGIPAKYKQIASSFSEAIEVVARWRPKRQEIDGVEFWGQELFGAETFAATAGVEYAIERRGCGWSWKHTVNVPPVVREWSEIYSRYLSSQVEFDAGPFESFEIAARRAIENSRAIDQKIKLALKAESEDDFDLDGEDPLSSSTPLGRVKELLAAAKSSYSMGYLTAVLAVRQQLQAAGLEAS